MNEHKSPFAPSVRPCIGDPRTLAGQLRRTDKQAIAFQQHLANEADLAGTISGVKFFDTLDLALALNQCVHRNGGYPQ